MRRALLAWLHEWSRCRYQSDYTDGLGCVRPRYHLGSHQITRLGGD